MNTILTDDELPPLRPQDHPEPHTMQWSQAEMRAIRAYARAAISAHDAKLAQQEPVAWMCSDTGLSLKGYSRFSPSCEGAWNIPVYTHPAPQQADRQRVPQAFTDWLCREMPPGTIISDPAWWAPKIIARAMLTAAPEAPAPPVVQVPQEIDVEGRRIAAEAENHACSLAVWMTRMDAESPDADDLGVSGWLQEAEKRIKRRMLAAAPEAPAVARDKLKVLADEYAARCSEVARKLASGKPDDSMSPIAVSAGDARMALHLAIDAALAQKGGK